MGALLSVVWGWLAPGTQVGAVTLPEDGSLGPEADVPDKTTGLTLRHRTAIHRTWDLVRPDVKMHGVNFFLAMFEAEPVLQTRFKGFAGKTKEELKSNKRLAAHGTTVFMAITSLVDNLEDISVLVELLKSTADNHRQRGVPKEDFELLSPILVKFLRDTLGSAWSPVAEEGWTQAMKVINSVIFSGYEA
uniref:Globin domain-containing protein n=1 Tax=Scylla olivacea TaxID=85551 RepID=A0A0P4W708_SCYOL